MTAAALASAIGWAGCAAPAQALPPPAAPAPAAHTPLADEDSYKPTYGKPELSRALIAERGAEATLERRVDDLEAKRDAMPGTSFDPAVDDQLRVATADLGVRRRFIATLETCESAGRWCPPRLDDPPWAYDPDPDPPAQASEPPLSAPLRFDLDSWRNLAAELYGRACACRTIACVDSVGVAIDELEPRAMPAVQRDDQATADITRARECLFRLRGKSPRPVVAAPAAAAAAD
jgi:hypothetical protein